MTYKFSAHHLSLQKITIIVLCSLLCIGCSEDIDPLTESYTSKKGSYPIRTRHINEQNEPQYINRLIQQDSPYLLQHAHNPVDWWSWGPDAFAAARKTDKPILLSVGYSTCHWCHVMERESFEDLAIAKFINEHFIPVKVDREERPDVDEVYMTAAQLLSGKTGWPLTVVLTPDGKPFFGGTYFAPEPFQKLLAQISKTWSERREAVLEQANRVTGEMAKINQSSASSKKISDAVIAQAEQRIIRSFQQPSGASGAAFPREPEMMFLLYRAYQTLEQAPYEAVEKRLIELAAGGLHDHLGGGFHRYSVDPQWKVPHFEKMLYNQAQMGRLYAQAYLMGGNETFKNLATSTLDFLLTTLQAPEGGFYAALDAESDGREGAYYVWSMQELRNILDVTELQVARAVFGVSDSGNFNGENVLYNSRLQSSNTDDSILDTQVEDLKQKLSAAQKKRPAPLTDTKIITAWNSMAVSALISGFHATGNRQYREAAERAVTRLWNTAYDSKRGLARTLPSDTVWIDGALEDYAYYANALIDMYDLTEDRQWLDRAESLITSMIERFHDGKTGGFRITSADSDKNVVMGLVTARDDAIISGNSMAASALARAYRRTGKTEFRQRAIDIHAAFAKQATTNPESLSGMLMSIGVLRDGEMGLPQYGARGKVKVSARLANQELALNIDVQPGWHVNAHRVLEKELIPTTLNTEESYCDTIESVTYPTGKRVTLGFQKDELLLYEGEVDISATLSKRDDRQCRLVGAKLRVQACSDEVCQAPETLPIRLSYLDTSH